MSTDLEMALALQLRLLRLPEPVHQHRFSERRWRFDLAWPDRMLAVEVDGGQWVQGRHQRPQGFAADCEKLNRATMDGWRVLRFATEQVRDGSAAATVQRALQAAGAAEEATE